MKLDLRFPKQFMYIFFFNNCEFFYFVFGFYETDFEPLDKYRAF